MPITIDVPRLLNCDNLDDLNQKMISSNHTFVFLGPKEELLNRTPSSWVEAFEMYNTGLYKVYHEFGMNFLKCYCSEAAKNKSDDSFNKHIWFVENCRAAIQHSGDSIYRDRAFSTLAGYVFNSDCCDMDFKFADWNDFWKNAEERHWKKATEVIIRDSNKLLDFLEKIASHDQDYQSVYEAVAIDFFNGSYNFYCLSNVALSIKKDIDMYESSLNAKFFSIVKEQLIKDQAFESKDQDNAYNELDGLVGSIAYIPPEDYERNSGVKTTAEIKAAIIDTVKNDIGAMKNAGNKSELLSKSVYDYILSVTEKQIKEQLNAKLIAEMTDSATIL